MSKDELQFIADLTEKHQIDLYDLLCIMSSGAMAHAIAALERGGTDEEFKMVEFEDDIARAIGFTPVSELLEGSDDFE